MFFLAPLTLIAASLAPLPVVIHLLVRRRAKRLDFPSLRFLRETPSFLLRPRRLRQPLLLALRVAALLLLVVGLARPLVTLNVRSQPTRIILVDASLSMRARGRTEAAREQMRALINRLAADERAAIITFSSEASVLALPTFDRRQLVEAVESYRPSGSVASYEAGLDAADTLLQRVPPGPAEIDIISDFQQSGLTGQSQFTSHAATRVITYPIGAELERNAFLLDEAVIKSERGIELSASEIVSAKDGRSGVRRRWLIDAPEGTRPDIEWHTEANGQITGRIRSLTPDDFDADDERFFAFTPPRQPRALLIDTDVEAGPYLRAALEAAVSGGQSGPRLALERRRELPDETAEPGVYSLVVYTLRGAAQANQARTLVEYARSGGSVWLFLARELDAASWNAFACTPDGHELPFVSIERVNGNQSLSFGPADTTAPPLHLLDEGALSALRAVRTRAGYTVMPRADTSTLMRWNNEAPAFVATQVGAGTIMLLATSPERAASDLGLSPALPALASSIWHSASAPLDPLSLTVGEAVHLGVAPEASVKITGAGGRTVNAQARELVRRPLAFFPGPGIYRIETGGTLQFLAFNTPVAESERALATADEIKYRFPEDGNPPVRQGSVWREVAERSGNAWRYFLGASFILLIAELLISMRRRAGDQSSREEILTEQA